MYKFFSAMIVGAFALLIAQNCDASLVIFDAIPRDNQANLTADAGQTFTTPGALGTDTKLGTVEQAGPSSAAGENMTYALQLFVDADQVVNTWGLGTILAETATQTIGVGQVGTFDFTSFNITLNPTTVYGLRFTNGSGTAIAVRVGLDGGNTALGTASGSLFSAGVTPFSNGFDSAMTITLVPEPGSLAMLLFGMISLWLFNTKRRAR